MLEIFRNLEFLNKFIVLIALLVLIIIIKKSIELFFIRKNKQLAGSDFGINAIPVIAGIMIVLDLFNLGFGLNFTFTRLGGKRISSFYWVGVHEALGITVFAFHFFLFALIIWFILRTRYNYLLRKSI